MPLHPFGPITTLYFSRFQYGVTVQNSLNIVVRNLHLLIEIMEEITKKVEKPCPNKGRKRKSQPDSWKNNKLKEKK